MKALLATGLLATLALVGCGKSPTNVNPTQPTAQVTQSAHSSVRTFKCDNGAEPTIRYLNTSQIEFTTPLGDSTPTVMNAARAASGELYVAKNGIYGKGGEWHQKGDTAVFTYYDAGSPSICKVIR